MQAGNAGACSRRRSNLLVRRRRRRAWAAAFFFAHAALVSLRLSLTGCFPSSRMVRVVYSRGPPPNCGPLPAPRPTVWYWQQAAKAQQTRLTLPAVSVPCARQPSDLEPHATFERFAAALPLASGEDSAWARSAVLHTLRDLHGPADALQLQPQPLELPTARVEGPVPEFLLLRRRTSHTDRWLRRAAATADVPCLPLPSPAADQQQGSISAAIMRDCQVAPQAAPPLPPPDRQVLALCVLNLQMGAGATRARLLCRWPHAASCSYSVPLVASPAEVPVQPSAAARGDATRKQRVQALQPAGLPPPDTAAPGGTNPDADCGATASPSAARLPAAPCQINRRWQYSGCHRPRAVSALLDSGGACAANSWRSAPSGAGSGSTHLGVCPRVWASGGA